MEERIRQLGTVTPKAVVVAFDVSGSMEKHDMLSRGREEVIRLVRGGIKPGDTWVVFPFDTATRKMVEKKAGGESDGLVADVPGELSRKPGTNIRWAHHEALRWVEGKRPPKTFLILVSDSYNDPPAADDPARAKYGAYYHPSSLTVYPQTPGNRDYERLLAQREALGITTWGIGVGIDERTGRPIERYLTPAAATAPTAPASTDPLDPAPPAAGARPWPWFLVGLALLVAGAVFWSRRSRPVGVSLAEGTRSHRNYQLRPGAAIRLGGAGAAEDDFAYPLAGTNQPVATLRREGKGFRLEPSGEAPAGASLLLNGEIVKGPAPIVPGDEIKVRLPAAPNSPTPRETRLEFGPAREDV